MLNPHPLFDIHVRMSVFYMHVVWILCYLNLDLLCCRQRKDRWVRRSAHHSKGWGCYKWSGAERYEVSDRINYQYRSAWVRPSRKLQMSASFWEEFVETQRQRNIFFSGSTLSIPLIKCLIPKSQVESESMETMIDHWMAALKDLSITVATIIIQWVIGLWEYQLVDRQRINIYYDCFFYNMLKKERLAR